MSAPRSGPIHKVEKRVQVSNANRLRRAHTKPKIQKITSFLNYFQAVYTGENGLRLNRGAVPSVWTFTALQIKVDVLIGWSLKQQERRVEIKGFEPLAYALQRHRSTN